MKKYIVIAVTTIVGFVLYKIIKSKVKVQSIPYGGCECCTCDETGDDE